MSAAAPAKPTDPAAPRAVVARRVLTMVPGRAAIDHGAVILAGRRVLDVGPRAATLKGFSGPILDLGPVTLTPGLLNAHVHLEQSHLGGGAPRGEGFPAWARWLLTRPLHLCPPEAAARALAGAAGTGTVFVADIATRHAAVTASVLAQGGADYLVQAEAFGFGPPDPDPLPAGLDPASPALDGHLALAGHALYSTSPERLRAAKAWDTARGLPFSLHLAEHAGERELLLSGSGELAELLRVRLLPPNYAPPGRSPTAEALRLGLLDARTLAVHAVHLDAADIRLLARSGAAVCLCPRSNALIGVGRAPFSALRDAGVPLCLGTDGLASNDDLDLFGEMRWLLAHADAFDPPALLAMATTAPARFFGREKSLGTLAPGFDSGYAILPFDLSALFDA